MKKILFILGCLIVFINSCENDPIFSQDQLYGTWENIIKDENQCLNYLNISDTSFIKHRSCAGYWIRETAKTYSFDGKEICAVFQVSGTEYYIIRELTDTTLVVNYKKTNINEILSYKRIK